MKRSRQTSDAHFNFCTAIITQAISDCRVKKKLTTKGKSWIDLLQNDPEYYLFESEETGFPSFIGVCHLMGLSYELLRERIKAYLINEKAPFTGSSIEMLRQKIREEKRIMRSELLRWSSKKLYVNKRGLDKLLYILGEAMEIKEEEVMKDGAHKAGRFYCWIGN